MDSNPNEHLHEFNVRLVWLFVKWVHFIGEREKEKEKDKIY